MAWLDYVKRDPVPWLLDPSNPSARYFTLRDIFGQSGAALTRARVAILGWPPVQEIIHQGNSHNFWGRSINPYYGGPVGTFGTLYQLAQLGTPPTPLLQEACENLLSYGRIEDGRFAITDLSGTAWLCYTGMALEIVHNFGMDDDPRALSARRALLDLVRHRPGTLNCPIADGKCPAAMVKALRGLLATQTTPPVPEDAEVIETLITLLLDRPYDFKGRDAAWVRPTFPRHYDSDLLELCQTLALTPYRDDPRHRQLMQQLVLLQTSEGTWRKVRASPSTQLESIGQPSRWLTYMAIHALINTYGDNTYAQ